MTEPASANTICSMPVFTLPQLAASCSVEDVPRGACAGDWGDDGLAELGDADLVEPGGEFLGGDALLCGLREETGVLVLVVGEGGR